MSDIQIPPRRADRIAADATVAMLDAQGYAWSDGDKKAEEFELEAV